MTRFDGLFDKKRKQQPEPPQTEPLPPAPTVPQVSPQPPAATTTAKSKDPSYQRSTVYLPKAVHQRLKLAAIQEGKEISEVIEELVREWLERRDA